MTWFLALQGAAHMTNQPSVYELQDSVDIDKIAQELVSSATLDRVVPIPAVLQQSNRGQQNVTLYVRPAAWGVWTFYQLSAEELRQRQAAHAQNPLLNALSQVAQQRA
jgi:O6-methylguanine-DNA--protein-cysteine methyltransferase